MTQGKWTVPVGWVACEDRRATELDLPTGHLLFGKKLIPVAYREDRDDFAYEVDGELYVVHLTFKRETDPRWPSTAKVLRLVAVDPNE